MSLRPRIFRFVRYLIFLTEFRSVRNFVHFQFSHFCLEFFLDVFKHSSILSFAFIYIVVERVDGNYGCTEPCVYFCANQYKWDWFLKRTREYVGSPKFKANSASLALLTVKVSLYSRSTAFKQAMGSWLDTRECPRFWRDHSVGVQGVPEHPVIGLFITSSTAWSLVYSNRFCRKPERTCTRK